MSSYFFFIWSFLISWHAKKLQKYSRSSYEVEYREISFDICDRLWLTFLIKELQIVYSKLPVIYCDSQSEMHIASNPFFHNSTKHLWIDKKLVCEKLQQGFLCLLLISTHEHLAYFLTKAQPISTFK